MSIHLTPSPDTHHSLRGKHYFTEGDSSGALLLNRSKQPLDHRIIEKEDKHASPCCKTSVPLTP